MPRRIINIDKRPKNFYLKQETVDEIKRLSYEYDTTQSIVLSVLVDNKPPKAVLEKMIAKEKENHGYI
ncbi:hypothetical protein [Cyanobacterium aponinum]|uniref:Uncharacterized protein n=1 Tax=Cyanobacterium aponinum AL20115 TaxID=3090662 RepID=A0AAF0ZCN8_9CHRO|nr:hypothetical protein [Cyanobacterium aponinum]WPF87567.1 hypothetical protein SAY89_12210 [Cyanobacterium aponinum AL20115]